MISIKIPVTFFTESKQIILKLICNYKRPRIARVDLREKSKVGGTKPSQVSDNTVKLWQSKQTGFGKKKKHKNRHMDQWNRIKSPEINPSLTVNQFATEEARIHNGEKTASLASGVWKAGQPHINQ